MYYNIATWCYRVLNWFSHSKIHNNFKKFTFSLIICNTSLNIWNLGMHSAFYLFSLPRSSFHIKNSIYPLWLKGWLVCTSILTSIEFLTFKKQMLQAANNDIFNPLVPKAHNKECQNLLFPLQIKPARVWTLKLIGGFFCTLGPLFFHYINAWIAPSSKFIFLKC